MKIKKILPIFCIALGLLSFASISVSETKQPIIRFILKSNKQIYEAGEEITISGFLINLTSQLIYIQTMRPFLNTQLIIKTPKDRQFTLIDDRGPFVPTDYSSVLPGEEVEYFVLKINGDFDNQNVANLEPFRESGTYEISGIYQDLKPLMERALTGTFSSETIKIKIVALSDIAQKSKAGKALAKGETLPIKEVLIDRESMPIQKGLITKELAILVATRYIQKQKAYQNEKMTFLFISDMAENNYWVVGFEEVKSKIFHAIKVHERSGKPKEVYFLE